MSRTGLVLGAGGLVGEAYELGVLAAMEDAGFHGVTADVLVGTSAGALVAGGLAAGLTGREQAEDLVTGRRRALGDAAAILPCDEPPPLLPEPRRGRPLAGRPIGVRPGALAASLIPPGRRSPAAIVRALDSLHPRGWPDRELRLCTVRVQDARRVVLGAPGAPRTGVGTAAAASCAVPGYFTPVRIDGADHVDGGTHSPTNADVLVGEALDLVVVLSPMTGGRAVRRPPVGLALSWAVSAYLAGEVRRLRRAGASVVVVEPGRAELAVMVAARRRRASLAEVLAAARAATAARLTAAPDLLGRYQDR